MDQDLISKKKSTLKKKNRDNASVFQGQASVYRINHKYLISKKSTTLPSVSYEDGANGDNGGEGWVDGAPVSSQVSRQRRTPARV